MVFLNDIQANKAIKNNSVHLLKSNFIDNSYDIKDANNNNSNNLNRQDNTTSLTNQEKRFVSTIILPSQYIDLSSYLYSPLRSIVSQQQLHQKPIVIGSTGEPCDTDKNVLLTDITSATTRIDSQLASRTRTAPQLPVVASHHLVSSTPDTLFKRSLRKEALNRIASTINTSSPNSSSDYSSLESNSLTSSLTSSTVSSLISSISSNHSDDMIAVNTNNTNNNLTSNSNQNLLNNFTPYIMNNSSSTSTSPIILNTYQTSNKGQQYN